MKILLLNLSTIGAHIIKAQDSIVLSYLNNILSKEAYINLFPKKDYTRLTFDNFLKDLDQSLEGIDAVGISSTTFSFPLAKKACSKIKKKKIPIIIGGSHIADSSIAKKTLEDNLVDYAVVGEAGAFIDLIRWLQTGEGSLPKGVYSLSDGKLEGDGKGDYPENSPAFAVGRKSGSGIDCEVLLTNSCPHQCGYCTSCKKQINVETKDYIKALKEISGGKRINHLFLYDNNPMSKVNMDRTKRFFDKFEKEFEYLPSTILYGDGANLIDNFEEAKDFMSRFRHPSNNLFFGREVTSETISKKIFRGYLGKIRDQEILDDERKALHKLAESLRDSPESNGLNFTIVINYILTPFETEDTLNALCDEIEGFSKYRRVIIRSNLLWPFPATKIREMYGENCILPENLPYDLKIILPDEINYWDSDFENSRFLDFCFALRARPLYDAYDPYASQYAKASMELAKQLAFKNKIKKDKILDLVTDDVLRGRVSSVIDDTKKDSSLGAIMRSAYTHIFRFDDEMLDALSSDFNKIMELKKRKDIT